MKRKGEKMTDLVQIACIDFDNLEYPEKQDWLASLPDEYNCYFVEVCDGDYSFIRDFETQPLLTVDQLYPECYVCASSVDNEAIVSYLDDRRERGKSDYSGEIVFRPETE
jgi:hypothetical protein